MPVMPDWEQQGYRITQAIALFLESHPVFALDGILFPSVQRGGHASPTPCRNVILFNKACAVVGAALGARPPYGVQLFEYEEDTAYFAPQISARDGSSAGNAESLRTDATKEPTLKLNSATLEIHQVRAVEFMTAAHHVFQHRGGESPA
jgi:RES domain